jgi:hypothetical protein
MSERFRSNITSAAIPTIVIPSAARDLLLHFCSLASQQQVPRSARDDILNGKGVRAQGVQHDRMKGKHAA